MVSSYTAVYNIHVHLHGCENPCMVLIDGWGIIYIILIRVFCVCVSVFVCVCVCVCLISDQEREVVALLCLHQCEELHLAIYNSCFFSRHDAWFERKSP